MPQLTDQLWELHYDLLSETEAERLRVRIDQEPAVAKAYDEVKRNALRIAQAARKTPTRTLSFVGGSEGIPARNSGNENRNHADSDGEKKTVSPPPELPEEITGSFPVALDSIPGSSVRLKSPPHAEKPDFVRKTVVASGPTPRTPWSPFSNRFSSKYLRSSRVLTTCSILFLLLTFLGFLRIRQTQSLIAEKLLQIRVAAPSVLARATQNTISVDVSDLAGNPKQLPVRVRLLSEIGEKIATYQEKTDSFGDLRLSVENPPNPSENVYLEITAGEPGSARTVRRLIPVVDAPSTPKIAPAELPALSADHSPLPYAATPKEELAEEEKDHPSVQARRAASPPHYSNSQNTMSPAMRGQKDGSTAGKRKMFGGGMGGMGMGGSVEESSSGGGVGGVGDGGTFRQKNANEVPAYTEMPKQPQSAAFPAKKMESAPSTLPPIDSDQLGAVSELAALPRQDTTADAKPEEPGSTAVTLTPDRLEFDATQPIRFQVRSHQSEQPLIASVSRSGIPLAQIAIKTSQTPDAPKSFEVPENDSLVGLLQISLFDPTTDPPKEAASCSVFRLGNHSLKITGADSVDSPTEVPSVVKITDETGKPVAASVRVSWGKGAILSSETIPAPTLIENTNQIRDELEENLVRRKPVFTEMLDFFTIVATVGGIAVSLIAVLLFLLRMVSGYVPLTVATITGIVCVLLGVSLMHDLRVTRLGDYLEKPAVQANTLATTMERARTESREPIEQWTSESDSQGICRLQLPERIEGPSTVQIEAFGPENRTGFARWELK